MRDAGCPLCRLAVICVGPKGVVVLPEGEEPFGEQRPDSPDALHQQSGRRRRGSPESQLFWIPAKQIQAREHPKSNRYPRNQNSDIYRNTKTISPTGTTFSDVTMHSRGFCPYHVVRPVRGTSCGATLRSVDATPLLRGLSAHQRTGPAPVALGAEELHPLYLVLLFHVIPSPGQGRGVVGEIALVNYIAHPVKKPIAGHADQPSARGRPKSFSGQRLYGVCCRNGL